MKEGDVAGGIFCLVLLFVFFKFFMIVGGLVALAAISYFGTAAYEDSDNRIIILKKRVAPSIIIMFLCFGIASSLPNHHKNIHNEAVSSSENRKESNNDADDEDEDDEIDSESDEDNDDIDDESDNTDTSSDSQEVSEDTNNENNNSSISSSVDNSNDGGDNNHGDMTTDQQGTIIGNSKSMIYHTPNQHGYRMNSANAVYFKTEAESQAAGYRKALR